MKSILEKLAAAIQYILPHHFLSSLIYRLMRVETVWIKNLQIRMISKIVGVNWSEASSGDLSSYRHFNAFFTRTLKPGARVFDQDENSLICPCDGRISELGKIDGNQIFQAKGQSYTLDTLLAHDPQCEQWIDGYFCTIYLSPRDYHRVHMPIDGVLARMTHVPGRLFSVAPYTVRQVPSLFARNERLISVFDTRFGPVAQVLVGAMLVSSMETVWDGEITPTKNRSVSTRTYSDRTIELSSGKEMGRFNMGSTVILVLPPRAIAGFSGINANDKVLLGQSLARLTL
ncbi:MAG: phosphatidylserine decarboxylase [Lysobacterales bacterium]|jgi:phosphatidylserine decarboxylase